MLQSQIKEHHSTIFCHQATQVRSMIENNSAPVWTLTHIDLLNEKYGGCSIACNDEFFAEASNLVKKTSPIFIEDKYTNRGKWMDGWESRRRRTEGHDWCILRLGAPGHIKAFDVDTTFFRGNAPAQISIEGCTQYSEPDQNTQWKTILDISAVEPHQHNYFEVNPNNEEEHRWTYLRLNIFPDGGVARLRAYGTPLLDWSTLLPNELVDLAASTNGGRAVACSDMFFSPMNNILAPGLASNMGDGWETRRRRGPGFDWLIVKLARPGRVARLLIDTRFFKGNFPESAMLEGTVSEARDITSADITWTPILAQTKLRAHTEHRFQDEIINNSCAFTHVKLNIYPDGGISRLRVFGYPELCE